MSVELERSKSFFIEFLKEKLKTFTIKRTTVGWFVILTCDDIPVEHIEIENNHIGIDVSPFSLKAV